jgi:hypothetical protein
LHSGPVPIAEVRAVGGRKANFFMEDAGYCCDQPMIAMPSVIRQMPIH